MIKYFLVFNYFIIFSLINILLKESCILFKGVFFCISLLIFFNIFLYIWKDVFNNFIIIFICFLILNLKRAIKVNKKILLVKVLLEE